MFLKKYFKLGHMIGNIHSDFP